MIKYEGVYILFLLCYVCVGLVQCSIETGTYLISCNYGHSGTLGGRCLSKYATE